jgi:hypothetical protein
MPCLCSIAINTTLCLGDIFQAAIRLYKRPYIIRSAPGSSDRLSLGTDPWICTTEAGVCVLKIHQGIEKIKSSDLIYFF